MWGGKETFTVSSHALIAVIFGPFLVSMGLSLVCV